MNNDEMKAEFLSFGIEAYKTKLGVSGAKVAEYFEESGGWVDIPVCEDNSMSSR